jgi:hypothetical protein
MKNTTSSKKSSKPSKALKQSHRRAAGGLARRKAEKTDAKVETSAPEVEAPAPAIAAPVEAFESLAFAEVKPLEIIAELQPVVVLLEKLLEKDPGRRFQKPAELLKAVPTITGALDAGRKITRQRPAEDALYGFACRNSQAAGYSATREKAGELRPPCSRYNSPRKNFCLARLAPQRQRWLGWWLTNSWARCGPSIHLAKYLESSPGPK